MKLAWVTDIHLNFLTEPHPTEGDAWVTLSETKVKDFCQKIMSHSPDALVITGDITEAPHLDTHLGWLSQHLPIDIYFVLGNHDFYHGSIAVVRSQIAQYNGTKSNQLNLNWLPASGICQLTEKACIIGHDGWYDGLYSNWFRSRLMMTDYFLITELKFQVPTLLFAKLQELAGEASKFVLETGMEALKKFDHLIVATHVPPFPENTIHKGRISDENWLPCMSSKQMGDALKKLAEAYPEKRITVLCGHTHGKAHSVQLPNLECYTGFADYGHPSVAKVLEIE